MACICSCSCSLPPAYPLHEYSKKVVTIPTTHGLTYCEIYFPNHFTYSQLSQLPTDSTEILLIVHGLGGSTRNFAESEIPAMIAQNNGIAICFDLYTHGRTQILSNKATPHNLDLFLTQVHDIVHSPDLFLSRHSRFHMLGFSFGGWITLNYLLKYHKNPNQPCCSMNHSVNKIIFQSPWDGYVPSLLRGLMHVPGLLRLCRPTDMAYINDFQALQHILLYADQQQRFNQCLDDLIALLDAYDEMKAKALSSSSAHNNSGNNNGNNNTNNNNTNSINNNNTSNNINNNTSTNINAPSAATIANTISNSAAAPPSPATLLTKTVQRTVLLQGEELSQSSAMALSQQTISDSLVTVENHLLQTLLHHHTAAEILFLSGKKEPLFTAVNNAMRKKILRHYQVKLNQGKKPDKKTLKSMASALEEVERRFPQRICAKADHMTFVHETNQKVGQFYRETIGDFLLPKYNVEIGEDQASNPQHPPPPLKR